MNPYSFVPSGLEITDVVPDNSTRFLVVLLGFSDTHFAKIKLESHGIFVNNPTVMNAYIAYVWGRILE